MDYRMSVALIDHCLNKLKVLAKIIERVSNFNFGIFNIKLSRADKYIYINENLTDAVRLSDVIGDGTDCTYN